MTADQTGASDLTTKEGQVIDGSGYMLEIPYSTKRADYIAQIKDLFLNSNYFNFDDLSFCRVDIAFYIPSFNMFISVMLFFEMQESGRVVPADVAVNTFHLPGGTTQADRIYLIFNILRFIGCLYTIWLICIKVRYRRVIDGFIPSIMRDAV